MPGVSATDAAAQKDVKGIEIVDQCKFCQDHFFLNAFAIQAVWRGILPHRGNMPQQGVSWGDVRSGFTFYSMTRIFEQKNRKQEREKRKSVIYFLIHFKDTF